MVEGGSDLFGVTILPPAVGGVPQPDDELLSALAALEVVHDVRRSLSDRIATGFEQALRFTAAILTDATYRPRTHGLSEREIHTWVADLQTGLSP